MTYSLLMLSCRYTLIGSTIMFSVLSIASTSFDPHALQLNGPEVSAPDLAVFNQGGQLPGSYRTDIYVNNVFQQTRDVIFKQKENKLQPQLTAEDWSHFGINKSAFPLFSALAADTQIENMAEYIPDVTSNLDFNRMRLNISIPQAALTPVARQSIDPARWDNGLPMAFVNYNASASAASVSDIGGKNRDIFMALSPGINIGPWRVRNYTTYSQAKSSESMEHSEEHSQWDSAYTYIQRDVHFLRSQLTVGETSSPGDIFESIRFLGVQLLTDDSMLPDSMKGFAPVVRGIAATNAQVTIKQNGNVIYQTYVAPGAFAIRDLYPTASSGNLDVTVREADGSERTFVQVYSAVPGMQREGQLRYSTTMGRYRPNGGGRAPNFVQSTVQYGLANSTTTYGGVLLSEEYQAGSIGIGQALGLAGSLSVDVTQAKTQLATENNKTTQGQSYRIQYTKDVFQSGTTFTLAGYRYSTSGYYDFAEANELMPTGEQWDARNWARFYNKRSRMQAQVSQSLGGYGSLFVSAYQQDYWRLAGKERTFSAGYNLHHQGISYGLNYAETQAPGSIKNRQVAFSVQIPLSRWMAGSYASYSVSADSRRVQNQVGLSGVALEDNALNYNVTQGYTTGGIGTQGSVAGNYKGSYGNVRGSYSYTDYGRQSNIGVEGSVVAHPYGLTMAQPLGTSSALVRAPGATNAKVQNNSAVKTDWRGFTVVPYLTPYRENRVALAPDSLPDDVDLESPVKTLVPTQGALVLADFNPRVGSRVLLTLKRGSGSVPFGATASLTSTTGQSTGGIVGEAGELYLSGVPERSNILIKWGNQSMQRCNVPLVLPTNSADQSVVTISAVCV